MGTERDMEGLNFQNRLDISFFKIGILGEQDRIYDEAEKCTVRMLPGKAKVVKELRGKSENVMINSPFYCGYGSYIEEGEIFLPTIIVRS